MAVLAGCAVAVAPGLVAAGEAVSALPPALGAVVGAGAAVAVAVARAATVGVRVAAGLVAVDSTSCLGVADSLHATSSIAASPAQNFLRPTRPAAVRPAAPSATAASPLRA